MSHRESPRAEQHNDPGAAIRRVLALPIILPLIAGLLAGGLALIPGPPNELQGLAAGTAMILSYALMVYVAPYLAIAVPLWIRAPRMGRRSVVLALSGLPPVIAGLSALGVSLAESVAKRRFVGASTTEIVALGLIFGYGYAAVGWLYLSARVRPAGGPSASGALPAA